MNETNKDAETVAVINDLRETLDDAMWAYFDTLSAEEGAAKVFEEVEARAEAVLERAEKLFGPLSGGSDER